MLSAMTFFKRAAIPAIVLSSFLIWPIHSKNKKDEKISCRQVSRALASKKKRQGLKNKLIFCSARLTSSMLLSKSYDLIPEYFHRWVRKYNKRYIFHITVKKPVNRKQNMKQKKTKQKKTKKKRSGLMNFYLLSNDEESKAVLEKNKKLDFTGQIVQYPIYRAGGWHFLVLREETAILIE